MTSLPRIWIALAALCGATACDVSDDGQVPPELTAVDAGESDDELTGTDEESQALLDPTVPIAPDLNAGSVNKLGELSGMVRSVQYPGTVWMHRDGHTTEPRVELFAMKVSGRHLVSFSGASGTYPTRRFAFGGGLAIDNNNWEEITLGTDVRDGDGQSLYIGDIGNNSGGRNNYQVYQIAEPNPAGSSSTISSLQATWRFAYPSSAKIGDEYPNCEAMFLLDRNLYIVTKESQPRVYRFPGGFYNSPGAVHTLVQVVNGGTARVVGATSNPSYAQFNQARSRLVMGNHKNFKIWDLGPNSLTGDALVRRMLLDPALPPRHSKTISKDTSSKMNAEAATFDAGSDDVLFGTESKRIYHWPAANYQN